MEIIIFALAHGLWMRVGRWLALGAVVWVAIKIVVKVMA